MNRDSEKYHLLIENLPDAFAYHRIVIDDDDTPVDYIFLEVNAAFEEMTGLKREKIIGKKVTEILPGIEKSEFNWIGTYGKVALSSDPVRFESFSEPLGRWYDVSAYSDEPGFFVTLFRDISVQKKNESNLQRSEKSYKYLTNSIPEMVVHFDTKLRHIYGNQVVEQLLGIPADFFKGKTFLDLLKLSIPEEQANQLQAMHEALDKCLQSGEEQHFTDSFILPEGKKYFFTRVVPEKGKNGEIVTLLAVTTDITTYKQAEVALQEQGNLLKGMFQSIQDGISVLNADLTIREVNQTMEKWYGHALPLIGKKCFEAYQNRSTPCEKCPSIKALEQKTVCSETVPLMDDDDQVGWIELYAYPLIDEATGSISGVVEFVRNITKRKQSEEELLKFKTAVEQSTDGVAMSDMDGNILFINNAWANMHGYSAKELIGCHLNTFHNKEQTEKIVIPINERLVTNGSNQSEVGHTRKDGTTFLTHLTSTILKGSDSKPFGMLAIARDITERKQAEEALKRQASERAAVDTFTYSVSNDLQAPLRRIEGFSEALLEECTDQLSDQARDYLNRIVTQGGSMKKRTDALLQLSRVVSREIDRETVDLSALIRSNLEKLQYKEPERQLELVVAPGLITEGDTELLNLMLAKLLDNAWKFSSEVEDAKIEFGSTVKDGRTIFYLKDNGIGFKMSHAEKLFAPFQKLHSGSTYPGIGIGLNLAYRIISRHGGEIWAEGEPGKGACFFFTLP